MIKSTADLVAYIVIGIMLFAFSCMAAGYAILIHKALQSPERKRMLKLVFWSTHDPEMDPRGRNLIALGAAIGAVAFVTLFAVLIFATRK